MIRICTSLHNAGYNCTLVGVKKSNSLPIKKQAFSQIRLNSVFEKGKLFYLFYNIRLFWFLLFSKNHIICAIDLDTILPAWLVSRFTSKILVYDAHEYFTEVEEIANRPFVQKMWKKLERLTLPTLKYAYTVNDSFASIFKEEYGLNMEVVRNATVLSAFEKTKKQEKYILYQGFVNIGRGLEQTIEAMQYIDCKLIICGKGDILDDLKQLSQKLNVAEKVEFRGFVAPDELQEITRNATIGLTLFKSEGKNNYYSLANRFFDYMHAEIPQIIIKLPEYERINSEFDLGIVVDLEVEQIKNAIQLLLTDNSEYEKFVNGAKLAKQKYNWQNEEKKLLAFYSKIT
jgi:glycosyltransferase involved in cell wall biosynthesis